MSKGDVCIWTRLPDSLELKHLRNYTSCGHYVSMAAASYCQFCGGKVECRTAGEPGVTSTAQNLFGNRKVSIKEMYKRYRALLAKTISYES